MAERYSASGPVTMSTAVLLLLAITAMVTMSTAVLLLLAITGMVTMSTAVLVLLAITAMVTTEAAKIETFNPASCDGSPTNTFQWFHMGGNTCQWFIDLGAVRICEVSSSTRVSVHNQRTCDGSSNVAQIYGPECVVQGATKLRSVWIQG